MRSMPIYSGRGICHCGCCYCKYSTIDMTHWCSISQHQPTMDLAWTTKSQQSIISMIHQNDWKQLRVLSVRITGGFGERSIWEKGIYVYSQYWTKSGSGTLGDKLVPLSVNYWVSTIKNHHHHDHCWLFRGKPSIQLYPNTPWENSWIDVKTHRGADITNVLQCNGFLTIFYMMTLW